MSNPLDETGDLKDFKHLPESLSPEVRDLALAMRRLLKASGRSLRAFSASHHMSASTASRYLSGERLPEKYLLDALLKSACSALGQEVTSDVQEHLYRLHREALLADRPAKYHEQMASDRLEDAILQREQADLQINDLRAEVSGQKSQLRALESQIQQIEAARFEERQRCGNELELYRRQRDDLEEQREQLRMKIQGLESALQRAIRERDSAQKRCAELEAELATAEYLAEREELEWQAAEERSRSVRAANSAEQHLVDLERIRREAEQVRRQAAQEAAAHREEAEATAKKIIAEASTRVTKIRPSMVPRTAALRRLREVATDIAEHRLPILIGRLSRSDPADVDTWFAHMPIDTRDEIGDIARAFDQVHRMAVEQALLRARITAIFTAFARRTQALIAGQLALLDDLKNDEAGPQRLTDLDELGRLATRARRHTETLLTLAGEEPNRYRDQPVPLIEVLLAARCEVGDYQRIKFSDIPKTKVHGRAVTDLVHLLAELLENATTFSPPQDNVRVTASRTPDGLVSIEIHSRGIGLISEDYADINERLACPPVFDTSIARGMGLFVVGQLSGRHGVLVRLRPTSERAGTATLVMLPRDMTLNGDGQPSGSANPLSAATPMRYALEPQGVDTM